MTLNELKYIIAVAKERHFRKASETCFVSQPTLSVAVKKLEEELGVVLFERRKQDVLVTPVGRKIISIAEEIVERSQDIKQIAKEAQGDLSTELKVGAIHTIAPYLIPKIIPIFHKNAPNVPVIIEENYTHVLADKLQTGELDLVILSLPFQEPNIETCLLYEEPFKLIVPKEHPLSQTDTEIVLQKIENETILLLGAGHCFRDQVIEAFPNLMHLNYQSDRLQKTFEGSSLETIRYMVASGVGLSIFPCSSLSERDNELFTIKELSGPTPTRKIALAWRKSFPREEILQRFKQSVMEATIPCTIPYNSDK
ncbi:LysR substrate-binding domain-containing protein [Thiomicrorhabdus sp. zzn3]|uniref:hydrogen peroxide-inducible genes activator n=1 Tax=Thiomicrorhabdus sp. zzn3 TaxID=3039775 RepID=UPI0024367D1E|nr:hydrogen peroxide-inducible genes activator [Thiomicrorhabdus sp. zzn3]MDG6778765.1 LysR substrate-binding domain-containing protein [Thiomicrorhabdus sp. zzn3]